MSTNKVINVLSGFGLLGIAAFYCAVPSSAPHASAQQTVLDHTKPWFIKPGSPICVTKQDLAALRDNAVMQSSGSLRERKQVACVGATSIDSDGDIPVTEVDRDGSFVPDYQVRLPNGSKWWTPSYTLHN